MNVDERRVGISDDPHSESEVRAAVQFAVIQLCADIDTSISSRSQMSAKAIAALAELTYLYATTILSSDLEAFANHAGRKTITETDVKLVLRKHPDGLGERVEEFCRGRAVDQDGKNDSSSEPPIRPDRKKRGRPLKYSESYCDMAAGSSPGSKCTSSSSSSDDEVWLKSRRRQRAAATLTKPNPSLAGMNGTTTSRSGENPNSDEHAMMKTKLSNETRRKFLTDPDDSSTSDTDDDFVDQVSTTKPTGQLRNSSKRFLLPNRSSKSNECSNSSDGEDRYHLSGRDGSSRIKEILNGISSQDSVSSSN